MEDEIELNFRLDREGRTLMANSSSSSSSGNNNNDDDDGEEKAVVAGEEDKESRQPNASNNNNNNNIDYQSKTIMTNLATTTKSASTTSNNNDDEIQQQQQQQQQHHQQWLDDLLFDCEITDSGLLPRTFWVPADDGQFQPRCTLEKFALEIFHHHVPSNLIYDKRKSGVEWWAQIRPSPEKTGRYTMFDDNPDFISTTGISFHWDKDEDLRLLTGGTTYIHPYLSTVTYLTDFGCPTLAINCRVNNLTGAYIIPGEGDEQQQQQDVVGFVSWPKTGKHLSFDGRYLHAALPDLMEPGQFEQQITFPQNNDDDPKLQKLLKRRHRRVTFLVNIWLNYQPFNTKPFPESMIDKLSGAATTTTKTQKKDDDISNRKQNQLTFDKTTTCDATKCQNVSITNSGSVMHLSNDSDNDNDDRDNGNDGGGKDTTTKGKRMIWPMGDCNSPERLEAIMPVQLIQKEASDGGNIQIKWSNNKRIATSANNDDSGCCFRLYEEQDQMKSNQPKDDDGDCNDNRSVDKKRESSSELSEAIKGSGEESDPSKRARQER